MPYVRLAASLLLSMVMCPRMHAEGVACPPKAALLLATDPAYPDAMHLKSVIESHNFTVRCVFPSKLGSIFQVEEGGTLHSTIEGEASLRTNYGDLDVVFMPKPQTFSDFKIIERREGGGFLYRFEGTPRVWAVNKFGSANRIYFLDYENQLFFCNELLMRRLEQALQIRHRKL